MPEIVGGSTRITVVASRRKQIRRKLLGSKLRRGSVRESSYFNIK